MRPLFAAGLALSLPAPLLAQDLAPEGFDEAPANGIIIVTARRRAENAQDVPAALTVVGARR